jgi:hypothetical protein
MRDELHHALRTYNQDLAVFKEALIAEGTVSALLLLDRIEAKGAGMLLLSRYDLTLIYNGMSKLEMNGVEQRHSEDAALKQRGGGNHAWGNDPVGRFRNWQKWILDRV